MSKPIDFTQVLNGPHGSPLTMAHGEEVVPLTLGRAASQALFYEAPTANASGEDKFMRAGLAFRIKENPAATLSVEEIALIKKKIGEVFAGFVVHPAWLLLDPALKP